MENQPANSDEPAAKTDSHSSSQSDAKSDSRSNVAEVAKDAVTTELPDDEVVKSKPLPSVSQGRSEDDVAMVGDDPLPDTREAPPISQTSSPAERDEIHTLELEPTHVTVDTKSLQGESTLELEHEKEGENVITTKSHVVNRPEVGVVSPKLEAAVDTESSVLPSAPALIDFCTDMDEVGGAEIVGVSDIAGQSAEVEEEGNKILYPRLDSIMRGTDWGLLIRSHPVQYCVSLDTGHSQFFNVGSLGTRLVLNVIYTYIYHDISLVPNALCVSLSLLMLHTERETFLYTTCGKQRHPGMRSLLYTMTSMLHVVA